MVCGTQNWWEGEGGYTYNSIRVDECDTPELVLSLEKKNFKNKEMVTSFSTTIQT
jgi:hypothetical protein